ncbi:helix-turn-helix transcriptional regulator [Adlercreutzia sp. ZJ154]|uniref:helix-turn-helix transcriptional regulator n=1 Tax=Adlercreutzia sp. ZJ154 TaxID=2709790 RepID=UPI0013EB0399|nr:helix-turn-helix transcriptional regulator [Adlercreutzia sp. ZJ154]
MPEELVDKSHKVTGAEGSAESENSNKNIIPFEIEALIAEDYDLSKREQEILHLLLAGHTMSVIADKLFISKNTVKSHYYHMYRKLGVNSKQEVIDIRDKYVLEKRNE